MSIKVQKVIKYIPVVNFVVVFFWIKSYAKYSTSVWRIFKPLIKIFFAVTIVNIPRLILAHTLEATVVYWILYYATLYVTLFIIAHITISDQEKLIQESQ